MSEDEVRKNHLTLVNDKQSVPAPAAPRRLSTDHEGQFQLELKDGHIRHILIIVMDAVHGTRLAAMVDRLQPIIVVDLRQTLRFDQPGLSRTVFFDQLNRSRSTYLREPVEWPRLEARHLATNQQLPARIYHEAVERWEKHLAFLVSKVDHARHLNAVLNLALSRSRADGWDIEQVA